MSAALEYLENIQGLILYTQKKHNRVTHLSNWFRLSEDILQERIDEFKLDYKNVLDDNVYEQRRAMHILFKFKDLMDNMSFDGYVKPREATLAFFKDHLKEIENNERLYSKFEPISYLGLVKMLQDSLEISAERLNLLSAEQIAIGTVATQGINACAFKLENGEGVIILERDLMSLLHLTAKSIILSFAKQINADGSVKFDIDIDEVEKAAEDDSNPAFARFKDLVSSYVKSSPLKAQAYELHDEDQLDLASYLLYGAELFVTGHEYGHLIKEHRKETRKIFCINPIDGVLAEKWEKEFEADNVGVRILLETNANYITSAGFQYVSAELFFVIYDIASKALSLYEHGHENGVSAVDSHPPYEERIERLRTHIASHYDNKSLEEALNFSDLIRKTLEILWQKTRIHILKMHSEKK